MIDHFMFVQAPRAWHPHREQHVRSDFLHLHRRDLHRLSSFLQLQETMSKHSFGTHSIVISTGISLDESQASFCQPHAPHLEDQACYSMPVPILSLDSGIA